MTPIPKTNSSETAVSADGRNCGQEMEYLLKLVAQLESYNMALLNKLNQTERELATLKQSSEACLPGGKQAGLDEQACGWERKLTRTQWRPS